MASLKVFLLRWATVTFAECEGALCCMNLVFSLKLLDFDPVLLKNNFALSSVMKQPKILHPIILAANIVFEFVLRGYIHERPGIY